MKFNILCLLVAVAVIPVSIASGVSLKEQLTNNTLPFTDENVLKLAKEFVADITIEHESFKHFKESVRRVREHNSQEDNTYTIDVDGPFAFMSDEEFFSKNLGGSGKGCAEQVSTKSNFVQESLSLKKIPASMDWRNSDKVSPIKDQQSCSSSWAFASVATIESHFAILESVEAPSLSEQQLVDCSTSNSGCDSGIPSKAFEYIKNAGGLAYENSYFYESLQQECAFESDTVGARLSGFKNIASGNEKLMKEAVGTIGPVTAVFYVLPDFKLYKSGIYHHLYCNDNKAVANHAVAIVGYGSSLGSDYWIAKNSWSEYWGDEGYFKIKRGNNMCGIANCVSYPIMSEDSTQSKGMSFMNNFKTQTD